jgi:uncharacterized protein YdaU (DUF1376 family)
MSNRTHSPGAGQQLARAPNNSTLTLIPRPQAISFAMLPWYPSSFISATRGWSVTARGIYRELLDSQWELGSLPADSAELQRLIGATNSEWKHWPIVSPKFPQCSDGLRRNSRLEQHRAKCIERSKKAAASAHQRWNKGGNGHANA